MSDRIAVMDAGRVLQVGTPADIYDRPASRFVAGFIGETDLLDAVAEAPVESGMRFRLPGGGEIVAADPNGVAPGARATLAFRPERVDLVPPGDGGIPAAVTETVYSGTDTVAHLALDGGAAIRARLQNRRGAGHLPAPGDRVAVRVPAAAVRVLPG